ncbi:MAG: hypothetical protein IJ308_03775 [Clostridia bacterium]|nr:hypothetical protein [Clostridia bacterium]
MQENVQKEEGGVSLLEILRLLLSKIKLLILVVLVAGIAGGSFALYTSWNDLHFGTRVEFYVNPEKPKASSGSNASQFGVYGAYGRHVMDNMVKLLESESFTEQLLLNGETLPKLKFEAGETTPLGNVVETGYSWSWVSEPSDEERAANPEKIWAYDELEKSLVVAKIAREEADGQLTLLETLTTEKAQKEEALTRLNSLINQEWFKFYPKHTTASVFSEVAYETLLAKAVSEKEQGDSTLYNDIYKTDGLNTYYESWSAAKTGVDTASKQIKELNENYFYKADEAEKTALDLWRATPGYKDVLKKYSGAVSYSYLEANADVDDANNLARSFIYVNIAVVGEQNQPFAEEVHQRVKDIVPEFVKNNMTVPADYEGTNCERITRTDEIHRTNPNHRTTQVIKYGLLFGAAALVIAAVVIIIVDKSDKRLRDTEVITRKFNVPILGIVPSIDELNEEAHARKVAATKAPKNTNQEAK